MKLKQNQALTNLMVHRVQLESVQTHPRGMGYSPCRCMAYGTIPSKAMQKGAPSKVGTSPMPPNPASPHSRLCNHMIVTDRHTQCSHARKNCIEPELKKEKRCGAMNRYMYVNFNVYEMMCVSVRVCVNVCAMSSVRTYSL